MNPDRLFSYLDGRLPAHERAAVEEELMNDEQARREFDVARRIHQGMQRTGKTHPEILSEETEAPPEQGRKIGRQVLAAAAFLVALNVAFGLFIIARHESANPNRELLRKQSEAQLRKALESATANELTPAPLGLSEVTMKVPAGSAARVADAVMKSAQEAGGQATKGVPDADRLSVLAEVPAARAAEFVKALPTITGVTSVRGGEGKLGPDERATVMVQIAEEK